MSHRKSAIPEAKPRRRWPRILAYAVILAVSALTVWAATGFWNRMPIGSVRKLHTPDYRAMGVFYRRSLAGESLAADQFQTLSESLGEALTGQKTPDELTATMNIGSTPPGTSQLWRLQLAAARTWLLEQNATPRDQWWPVVRVYLEGLENAHFQNYQKASGDLWAAAYRNVGVDVGTAAELGADLVGNPHGPFVQYFAQRLRELIEQQQNSGDAAGARLCERILLTLLRDWVLESGPMGPRLLAAEKLTEYLQYPAIPRADAESTEKWSAIGHDLSVWRSAYLDEMKKRPIAVLSPRVEPAWTPAAHQRLLFWAALASWLYSAGIATAGVAIVLAIMRIIRRKSTTPWRDIWPAACIAAVIVLAGGLAWYYLTPGAVRADFRSDFSSLRYTWRHPFLAGGLALLISMLAELLRVRGGSVKHGFFARWEPATWMLWGGLMAMLLVSLWAGEKKRQSYERELRAACENPIVAVLGQDGEQRLDRLRQWTP